MKNYVGRKIRGFRFEDGTDGVSWVRAKEKLIGEIGEVESQHSNHVFVIFKNSTWLYPISLIEPHLIEECTPVIPQLGEGILMEVSDDGVDWGEANIIAKLSNGRYLSTYVNTWRYARPIPQLPKYTHAELVEKLGHDFEYINK
jgi:hypothetical protein